MQFGGHHTADETLEGVELVYPCTPKSRHGGDGDGDATEEGEEDYDEGVYEGGDECVGGKCCDGLA